MKNPPLGPEAITRRFTVMADRAAELSGERPEALQACEEAILHLGGSEDRALAQRILLRAQDANRMTLPESKVGFTWFGGIRLDVRAKNEPENVHPVLSRAEASSLWLALDEQMRDLSFADMGAIFPPRKSGRPTWPAVMVHSSIRCDAGTRAWLGFHCLTNMDAHASHEFSVDGSVRHGALILVAPIPDPSMTVSQLQNPAKEIPQEGWAAEVRKRIQAGLTTFMALHPHLVVDLDGPWQRLSSLIEQGELACAVASLDALGEVKGLSAAENFKVLREQFPTGLALVVGGQRTGHPYPGQAALFILANPATLSIAQFANASLLAGTSLEDVSRALSQHLDRQGIATTVTTLEPQAPIDRLNLEVIKVPCSDGKYRSKEIAFFGKSAWRFNRFDWNAGWALGGPSFHSDEAVRRLGGLPHPIAMDVAGVDEAMAQHYGPDLLKLVHAQMDVPGRSNTIAANQLMREDVSLVDLTHDQEDRGVAFDDSDYVQNDVVQPPEGVYCASHWKRSSGALMVAKTTLMDRLEQTSIENGFPLRFLRLPYPDIYVHFQRPVSHLRSDGRKFSITGFYASEEKADGVLEADSGFERVLAITYTYLYDGDVLRVGGLSVFIPIAENDTRDLTEVIAAHNRALDVSELPHDEDDAADTRFTNETLVLAAKVILYTTLKSARVVPHQDRTKLIEEMRGLKGSKREKLQARIKHAYDHIVIGPEEPADQAEDRLVRALEARGIKPHWRRGFYRTQWYGEGRTLQYQVLIPPVLVNGHLVDGSPPPRKDYTLE